MAGAWSSILLWKLETSIEDALPDVPVGVIGRGLLTGHMDFTALWLLS